MNQNIFRRVVDCISATTRYPTDLLIAKADLENDLGIDSVKNLEIVLALADEFEIDLASQNRDPSIRTIGDVAGWIDGLLNNQATKVPLDQPLEAKAQSAPNCNGSCAPLGSPESFPKAPHYLAASQHVPLDQPPALDPRRSLAGRVALVTGSGRGVGRTIARVLAERGAHVVVNSFHSRDEGEKTTADILARGGQAVHLWGSIANPEHVDRIFEQIETQFGRLDILVCNASDGRIGSFMELTAADWEKAFRTNVSGHHQCAVRAAKLMQSSGGSIVTMSAVGADRYIDGLGSQGVVKAAVETLTRYLACELGRFGIRVNCVAGGPVYGELLSKFPSAGRAQQHWESMTPDGELCSPMDLANAVGFLLSDEARGINGSVWTVDHGFSATADGRAMGGKFHRNSQPALI